MERYFWCQAASVAAVLGREAPDGIPPGSELTEEFRADVEAFFGWLPSKDRATFEEPSRYAAGIPYVIVNGVPVVDGSAHTKATPGRVLRRGPHGVA